MFLDNRSFSDEEKTVELPAQEKVAHGSEAAYTLSAEQVYGQRLAEQAKNKDIPLQDIVP